MQPFTSFFEFSYGEGGGLKGVIKGAGLHGVMHCRVRSQGWDQISNHRPHHQRTCRRRFDSHNA